MQKVIDFICRISCFDDRFFLVFMHVVTLKHAQPLVEQYIVHFILNVLYLLYILIMFITFLEY